MWGHVTAPIARCDWGSPGAKARERFSSWTALIIQVVLKLTPAVAVH
jgi:hypothetical protein